MKYRVIYFMESVRFEPSPDEVRKAVGASGGRASVIFYDGETCRTRIKYPRE